MTHNENIVTNPIKEIIFGISFTENISLDCLNKFISIEKIKAVFPIVKQGYNANLKAKTDGTPPVPDVQKAGYILKCDDPCNRILQAKIGLFAFHKTKEYEAFERLISELDDYWELFQTCTGNLTVTNVSLRYLNFIEIGKSESIADYVQVNTSSPFRNNSHNFIQLKFKAEQDEKTEATVVVTNGADGAKEGVILDIILNRTVENNNFTNISSAFEGMRAIKNDIFQKAITEKTKLKYNL